MRRRLLAGILGLSCVPMGAFADGLYRMMILGDFDLPFIDEAVALDSTGRLEIVDLNAVPGPETGPEILAFLARDWNAAEAAFNRRDDQQLWSNLQPSFDPGLIVRRLDQTRENGTQVRLYVFVAYVHGEPVSRECQAALVARDFGSSAPLPVVTLASC